MPFWEWSKTAASNATADPTINWAEGQSPSSVNDSARAMMARTAEWRDDISGTLTMGGTSTAYTVTTNEGLQAQPQDGQRLSVRAAAVNGIAATLTADGGNTYPFQNVAGTALTAGLMQSGGVYDISFSLAAGAWLIVGYLGFAFGNVNGPAVSVAGDVAIFADTTGRTLSDGGALGPLALQQSVLAANLAPGAAPGPFIAAQSADNLHLSNDGTNATRDVDISAGRVRNDADTTNLQLAGTMVKRLDSTWAAGGASGSPAGGCDTGAKGNSQTWHAFIIGNLGQAITQYARSGTTVTLTVPAHGLGAGGTVRVIGINVAGSVAGFDGTFPITATGTNTISYTSTVSGTVGTTAAPAIAVVDGIDCVFSQSYSAPTLPSGWTVKQCLGSIITDVSANIIAFNQYGDEFWLTTPPLNVNGTTLTTTASLETLTVPNGVKVQAILNVVGSSGAAADGIYVSSPDATDTIPSFTTAPLMSIGWAIGGATSVGGGNQVRCNTGTGQQVRMRAVASTTLYVSTMGWRDYRRRMF